MTLELKHLEQAENCKKNGNYPQALFHYLQVPIETAEKEITKLENIVSKEVINPVIEELNKAKPRENNRRLGDDYFSKGNYFQAFFHYLQIPGAAGKRYLEHLGEHIGNNKQYQEIKKVINEMIVKNYHKISNTKN